MEKVIPFIIYFFIYSFIGFVAEEIYCSIIEKKLVIRGFLFGPILPIYGFAMLAVNFATEPVKDNLIMTFFVSMGLCSLIEYFTSWVLEKLFGIKWWDYTNDTKFNLNGRICLQNSLLFGIAGCLIVKQIHPNVVKLVGMLGRYENIVAFILTALFLIDTIASVWVVVRVKRDVRLRLKSGDQTNEIKRLARNMILKLVTGKNAAERKIKKAQKVVKKKQK